MKISEKTLRAIPILFCVFVLVNNYSDGISKDFAEMQFIATLFWWCISLFLYKGIIQMLKKQK